MIRLVQNRTGHARRVWGKRVHSTSPERTTSTVNLLRDFHHGETITRTSLEESAIALGSHLARAKPPCRSKRINETMAPGSFLVFRGDFN
jgi:hypothetical protein